MAEPASERKEQQIEDREVLGRINELVNEEHELYHRAEKGGLSAREHERLRQLEVNLDQCWDLLRQRRALREAGYDPDEAKVRDEKAVEGYLQ